MSKQKKNALHNVTCKNDDIGAIDMFGNPTYRGCIFRYNFFHHIGSDKSFAVDISVDKEFGAPSATEITRLLTKNLCNSIGVRAIPTRKIGLYKPTLKIF